MSCPTPPRSRTRSAQTTAYAPYSAVAMSTTGTPTFTGGRASSPVALMIPLSACRMRSRPRRSRYGPVRPKPVTQRETRGGRSLASAPHPTPGEALRRPPPLPGAGSPPLRDPPAGGAGDPSRPLSPCVRRRAPRARLAQPPPQAFVADEPLERRRDRVGLLRLHEQAGDVPLDDALVAMYVAGHDWQARGHGLEQDDAERFLSGRRRAEDVRGLVEARLVAVVDAAREEHVGDAFPADEPPHVPELRPPVADDEAGVRMLLLELRIGAQEVHRALARLEPADEEDVDLAVAVLGEGACVPVELDVDAVRDDPVIAREVARDEVPRRARDGDACVELVQVMESDRLPEPVRH